MSTTVQDAADRVLDAFKFDQAYNQLMLLPNSPQRNAAAEQNRAIKDLLENLNLAPTSSCLNWDGGKADSIYTIQQVVDCGGA